MNLTGFTGGGVQGEPFLCGVRIEGSRQAGGAPIQEPPLLPRDELIMI